MKSPLRWSLLLALALPAFLLAIGCGGSKKIPEVKPMSISTVTVQTPPGALPDVPAEKGGEGFEKIAAAQGWSSNTNYPLIGDSTAKKGGMLRMSMVEFPSNLRHEGKDANTTLNSMIQGLCYESLMGLHSMTMDWTPGLATHWKISDDKKTFWFRIDPKARWADGTRLTTEDVVATWKLLVDPGILAPYTNQLYGKYEKPVAESPYIVRVTTKELNWRHFLYFAVSMAILPAKELDALEGDYSADLPADKRESAKTKGTDYVQKYQFKLFLGSGPYTIQAEDIIKDQSITLTRRNDYWDKDNPMGRGSANFDRIKFIVVQDERLTFEKFKKGEIDVYYVGRAQWWVEEFDFEHVKRGLIQKRKVYNYEPQGINGFALNERREPMKDIRVRKAMCYLFNRQKLIDKLFYKEYLPLNSYFPSSVYENENAPKFEYNPQKASELLAEAGWTSRDKDGYLTKNGKRFSLDLQFAKGQERFLTVIQEDFKAVGVELNLKESTAATMFKMVKERKFDIHFQTWTGLQFPNPESSMHSKTADPDNTTNLSGMKIK
ncbi:MAG: ABC transporter substrate-binding protein, partial [bacterium]|nr:ABC transporter substrate-binding protein [bacterium]